MLTDNRTGNTAHSVFNDSKAEAVLAARFLRTTARVLSAY